MSAGGGHDRSQRGAHPQLANTIEMDVVPQLVNAYRKMQEANGEIGHVEVSAEEVREFARLTLLPDPALAEQHIFGLLDSGMSIETIYLELFAPAARHLGERWEDDTLSFVDVSIGMCRMQEWLHDLSPVFVGEGHLLQKQSPRVLLAPINGEQHNFGVLLVAEFFRKAGWHAWTDAIQNLRQLDDLVKREKFSVVGFSISCESRLPDLKAWIHHVRHLSSNKEIGVLVGGRVFVDQPELAGDIGADGMALDAREAVERAKAFI